jgi:hypothetical protein
LATSTATLAVDWVKIFDVAGKLLAGGQFPTTTAIRGSRERTTHSNRTSTPRQTIWWRRCSKMVAGARSPAGPSGRAPGPMVQGMLEGVIGKDKGVLEHRRLTLSTLSMTARKMGACIAGFHGSGRRRNEVDGDALELPSSIPCARRARRGWRCRWRPRRGTGRSTTTAVMVAGCIRVSIWGRN